MARPTVSDRCPPRVDFSKTPLAYGLRAIPRILREMMADEIVIRRRALNSLAIYLTNPLHVQESLDRGVIKVLGFRLNEEDYLVRERTTACLQLITRSPSGREAVVRCDIVGIIEKRIDDEEDLVRLNTYGVFVNLAQDFKGSFEMANYSLVKVFVEKLHTEVREAKLLLLDILHDMMAYTELRKDVLDTPAMKYFTEYLQSPDDELCSGAARCIGDLAVETQGKTQADGCGTVEVLTDQIMGNEKERTASMGPITYALMMILIDVEARYRVLKRNAGLLERVIRLAYHPCLEVAVNCIKIATILAESPEGRRFYLDNFPKVDELQKLPDPGLKISAEVLISVINWKP